MNPMETRAREIFLLAIEKIPDDWEQFLDGECGDDSELRAAVERLLASHRVLGSFHEQGDSLEPTIIQELPAGPPASVSGKTSTESRFRILRPHAKGGLGEVSVAKDVELNRDVALKEIQSRFADDEASRSRFLLEAEVTGGLEHPGIVPVYGLGRYEDGRPYYAMRFIKGDSLKEAADRFHKQRQGGEGQEAGEQVDFGGVEFRKLLGRFIDVCQAIEYAHSRGVLHRDLKPGNIMLGKYGETLVVDWGLAKTHESDEFESSSGEAPLQPTSASGSATVMGSAIGTPAFMPPEQAAGRLDELGQASDVYSLGATLYYMLTGLAPFQGKDVLAVLKDVQAGKFPAPRSIQPTAPKALEAVCQQAMQRNLSDRYQSPLELADDIERYLADEAVTAHAEPFIVKTRRWVRKHQTLAASTAAVVLVSAIGLGVFSAIVSGKNSQLTQLNNTLDKKNRELDAKNDELIAANGRERDARQQAVENEKSARQQSQLALSTLGSVIDDIQNGLKDLAGGSEIRRRLLSTSLEKLKSVATKYVSQATVDRETMIALGDMGDMVLQFGASDSTQSESAVQLARSFHNRALAIAQSLAASHPDDLDAHRDLAVTFDKLGDASLRIRNVEEAHSHYERGAAITRELVEKNPSDADLVRDFALSHFRLGDINVMMGKPQAAPLLYSQGLKILQELAADSADINAQRDLALGYNRLGDLNKGLSKATEALAYYEKSLAIEQRLAADAPNNVEAQRGLLLTYHRLGDAVLKAGQAVKADEYYEQSLAIARRLTAEDPSDAVAQRDLLLTYTRLGDASLQSGKHEEAVAPYLSALEISETLVAIIPSASSQRDHGWICNNLGDAYAAMGRKQLALEHRLKAFAILEKLAAAEPNSAQAQRDLMSVHYKLGKSYETLDDWGSALKHFQSGITVLNTMIENQINVEESRRQLQILERSASMARVGALAWGEWDTLLQQPAEALPTLLDIRGIKFAQAARYDEASQAAQKLVELKDTNHFQFYNAACVFSLCAASVKAAEGKELSETQQAKRDAWIDSAIVTLQKSIEAGWNDFKHMQEDADLDVLRELPKFKTLILQGK